MPLPRRFQVSKFKNTTPKNPRKEDCIYDLPIGSLSSGNNGIKSSSCLLAFHIDGEGGKLGILPVSAAGRKLRTDLTVVCAHREAVTDFDFFPFRTGLLATCSRHDAIKMWELSDQNGNIPSPTSVGEANGCVETGGRFVECLAVHPTADGILAAGGESGALISDVQTQAVVLEVETGSEERVQCASWESDGRLLALGDKGRDVHLFDPRQGKDPIATVHTHMGLGREGRVTFLGDTSRLLTSGFAKNRYREVFLYDVANLKAPIHTKQFDSSTGLLLPLYDPDSRLVFLAGKGSNKVLIYELSLSNNELLEVGMYSGVDQTLGACLVPKSSLNVMEGEVDRLMQLTKNTIYPVSCIVPRKTYRDFHSELFPDSACLIPGSTGEEWLNGSTILPPKYSLDPAKRDLMNLPKTDSGPLPMTNGHTQPPPLKTDPEGKKATEFFTPTSAGVLKNRLDPLESKTSEISPEIFRTPAELTPTPDTALTFLTPTGPDILEPMGDASPPPIQGSLPFQDKDREKTEEKATEDGGRPRSIQDIKKQLGSTAGEAGEAFKKDDPVALRGNRLDLAQDRGDRTRSCVGGVRQSKYRHVTVTPGGGKGSFTNLRNVNTRLPLESNGFCVSEKWAAVPLSGPGAVVAIFDLSHPKKIMDGVIPGLANKSGVTELVWCPFHQDELAVGCEDGTVKIWKIPEEGVHAMMDDPQISFQGFSDKVSILRYHPVVKNVLAAASIDSLSIWDITSEESRKQPRIRLEGHEESILCVAWSADGGRLATVAKDRVLRIYEPTASTKPLVEKNILESTRGARVFFACADKVIATVSFSKSSNRQVSLYDSQTLAHLHTLPVDSSPQLLIPTYDYDSSVMFLTGKGDVTLYMYEVLGEWPWLMALNRWVASSSHQALSIQQKNVCDVKGVEFARGQRMTLNTVESLVFTVPRRKKDLFQNDLFPDSLVTWESGVEAEDYFDTSRVVGPSFRSLRPPGMGLLYPELSRGRTEESAPVKAPTQATRVSGRNGEMSETAMEQTPAQMKKDIVESMSENMDVAGRKELEQDAMEGVDEEEWHS